MLPIIKSIEEHVLSLPEKKLVVLAVSNKEKDFQLSFTNIEDLRNQVFNEITSDYEESHYMISKNVEIAIANLSIDDKEVLEANFKIARELSDKELLDIAKAGFKEEGVSHYKIDEEEMLKNIKHNICEGASYDFNLTECYEAYKHLKYCMTEENAQLLLKMGIKQEHLNHVIEFNTVENTFLDIIKSGKLFNLSRALFIIEKAYNIRILETIITNYYTGEKIPVHPKTKSRNVTIMEDDIIKVAESIKGDFSRVNEITLGKAMLRELLLSEPGMPISDSMRQGIRGNNNIIIYNEIKDFLMPFKNRFGRAKTRQAFAPMFYVIFENAYRKNAILTKEGFDEEIEKDSFFPWNNYNKYFSNVDRLVGLDGKSLKKKPLKKDGKNLNDIFTETAST